MKARIDWINKFHLEGKTQSGFTINMDSSASGAETKGPAPKELVLQALAGCTMMDVSLILEKSRKSPEKFWIDVEAEVSDKHPRVFNKIHLQYNFIGNNLDESIVERAINLSKDTYCAVSGMLNKAVEITYSFKIYENDEAAKKAIYI